MERLRMKDYLNEIDQRWPVRNTKEQKESFRAYLAEEIPQSGYAVRIVRNAAHDNVVIGNPEEAAVVFTAHYDTPRRALLPNLMIPLNPFLKYAYILIPVVVMLGLAILAGSAIRNITGLEGFAGRLLYVGTYLAVYFGLFLLMFRGPANRHNRNDNTSGTAAVLTLCRNLAGDGKAAFILFDDEEKGKKGSKAYAQACPEIRSGRLIVNLDCVGNGDNWIVSASEAAMGDPGFPALEKAMEGIGAQICSSRKASLNSDQKSFDKGVGICACLRGKRIGCYTPRIHTSHDTVASSENIYRLADALAAFVRS